MAAKGQVRTHKLKTKPPPVGGINARDGISIMPETDAVGLVNWIPDTFGVRCRKGYSEWAINFPSGELVSSLLAYISPSTTVPIAPYLTRPIEVAGAMFAATDAAIYDVSAVTSSPVATLALSGGLGAGMFSQVTLNNVAGSFLCAVSETDGYFIYDGAAWSKVVMGGGAGQVSGVDPADFCFNMRWKSRQWFVERDTTSAWYLPVDQITGAATQFDFGTQFKNGGHLSYLANWTIDAGEGIDDFLVAVSSNGDVVVYKGTDPDTAGAFSLVGTFFIGQVPVGRRGWAQYGGDLVLLSANGIYPMSFITRGGAGLLQATGEEYSSKIRSPLGKDLQSSFTSYGWEMMLHPTERIFLVNVPDYAGSRAKQFVMSTTQNKWTQFAGIPIRCFGRSLNYVFAGTTDGRVVILFTDYFDDVALGESVGSGIRGVVQPAFSFFDSPGIEKQFLMVRPMFLSIDAPAYLVTMSVNFSTAPLTGNPTPVASAAAMWNTALWNQAQWGGALTTFNEWSSVGGIGFSGAAGLVTSCVGETLLTAIDYMYADGGPM